MTTAPYGLNKIIIAVVAVSMSLWELIYASGIIYVESIIHRAIFLGCALILTFMIYPALEKQKYSRLIDIPLIVCGIACMSYFIVGYRDMLARAGSPILIDTAMGVIAIIMVLEAARRTAGLPLSIIAGSFLVHAYFSNYFPGFLHGRGFSVERISEHLYTWAEGIFGLPLEVASTYIFMFVIFGSFFASSGVGKAFIDLAFGFFGGTRGGPAKVSIVASGFFGTISGSAAANVVTTGAFTIPMMRRIGFTPLFAGAVETVASTGGMIMPPIMAAAAFLIAEYLAIPYASVMKMAIMPAMLYYFGLFWSIDAEACRLGLKGLPRIDLPDTKQVIKNNWFLFLPIILLVYILIGPMWSPTTAAAISIVAVIAVSWVRKDTRMDIKKIIAAFEDASKQVLVVATACAADGIIVGSLSLTGLGMNLSVGLISLAGDNTLLLLVLVAVASLILGMGLTPTAVYITLVILLAPILEKMGIPKYVAHFFIFYYGCLSVITPPVAVAAYAAAGLTKENPIKTGMLSVRLALPIFLIPFTFVYNPTLLLVGSASEVILSIATSLLAVYAVATAGVGHHIAKMNLLCRAILFLGGILLIVPEWISDITGFILVSAIVAYQFVLKNKNKIGQSGTNQKYCK